ncbi:HAD domain-containing protein [Pseudoduganella sp. R-34]|uniref:HAD domain-containing protein n=1 Tax=Pseudoduganella sp. R-34 TaxID=3404062 RepID=UPI003CEE5876
MVLFLDFDGVLHEYGAGESNLLRHVPLFAAILREHTNVDVVVASAWRKTETLSQLASHFPYDLNARFVGVTSESQAGLRQRERECWDWLCAQHRTGEDWIAIDDNLDNFGPDLPGLGAVLFVDPATGLDENACLQLRAMIGNPKPGSHFCYERSTVRGWRLWE